VEMILTRYGRIAVVITRIATGGKSLITLANRSRSSPLTKLQNHCHSIVGHKHRQRGK
jgi:hypothetical protein